MHRLQPGPTPYSAVPGPAVLACLLLVFAAATRAGGASAPGFRFVEAGEASGFQPYQMAAGKGGGAAAADYDADGDVDLFVPTAAGTPNHLYQNNGDGTFLEIAAEVGLDAMTGRRAALWFDYNGDNRLDLFVAGDCWNAGPDCSLASTIALYRQTETGAFEDVTGAAGLGGDLVFGTTAHRGGAAAGDFNNDGWLDLIVGLWMGEARLWRNNGDGTFTDVSLVSGIGGTGDAISHWQPVLYDFDRNGLLDVYYAVDFTANRFLMRQPNGMFIDGAVEAGLNNAWNDMGIALGDYDNDWDMDVYVTNIYTGARRNELYRNDSTKPAMAFERQASATGSGEGGWGWGCTFLDADNDGWVDLAATNGWFDGQGTNDPSRFFLNSGGPSPVFTDVGPAVGFDDTLWGSALVSADLDRDGDLDLVQTCNGTGSSSNPHALRLYRNDPVVKSNGNNWLVIKPRMKGPNRRAIGAEVRIEAGGVKQTRAITAGISHLGQEPAEAFFGLGEADTVDLLEIRWPAGARTTRTDVAANQVIEITGGTLVFTDITEQAGVGQPGTLNESLAWGDYDNDGDEDLYLTNNGPNRLMRNDGGGDFTDVTGAAGVAGPDNRFSVGTAFGDLDNDGDLDLYVVNFQAGADYLFRNDGPDTGYSFTEIGAAAGISFTGSSRGVSLIDYNRDGLLDIYVNAIGPDILYRNDDNLEFTNVAFAMGLGNGGQGVGAAPVYVNDDDWIDLFTGNRSGDPNILYRNDLGQLTDITAAAGITETGLGMGVHVFDYDNDLDFDLYWTSWPGDGPEPQPNALYENDGSANFVDVAAASGTADPFGWGISNNAGDIDNDGWEDFFVTNGFSDTTTPNVLFRNNGDKTFTNVTSVLGGGDSDGRGAAFADIDNDGDLDLCLTGGSEDQTRLWRNDSVITSHWITLELTGTQSNRSAIGARIYVTTDVRTTVKIVSGGEGRGSQNSLPVEFGLGAATEIQQIEIAWPSGVRQVLEDLAMDQFLAVTEPAGTGGGEGEGASPEGDGEGQREGGAPPPEGMPEAEGEGGAQGGEGEKPPREGEPEAEAASGGEGEQVRLHSADVNGDSRFDLGEILRVIQLYNAGAYACADDGTADGFIAGPGPQGCPHHSADSRPADWRIDLSELLRVLQLHSLGEFQPCPGIGEDGFCPGP